MLKNKLRNYSLILASGSPRRQQFFKDLDLDFEIRLKEIEEIYPPELKAEEITNYLAELKANAFEGELKANEILITSDTIVWHNGRALGKPKDEQDAFAKILSRYRNGRSRYDRDVEHWNVWRDSEISQWLFLCCRQG